MTTYYITVLLVAIFSLLAQNELARSKNSENAKKHIRNSKIYFGIAAFILIFVSGFRFCVGTDYSSYYWSGPIHANRLKESIIKLDEPGSDFIYWFIRLFTKKNYVPILAFAVLTIGFAMIVIYKNTDCYFVATMLFIFLGCWHFSFNALRQCLAASIVFYGIKYLKNREFIKYFIVVFVAFLFHRSAIIMIAPYFIIRNRISFKNVLLLIIGTVIVLYSYNILVRFTEFILQDSLSNDAGYADVAVNILRILVAVVPSLFYIVIYWNRKLNPITSFYIKLVICHAVVMVMASKSAMLARVGIYTAPFCCIAMPELNKIFRSKTRKVINIIMLLLYAIYFFYEISNSNALNNFQWVFNYMDYIS